MPSPEDPSYAGRMRARKTESSQNMRSVSARFLSFNYHSVRAATDS